jgi:hypothetical protein
LHPASLHRGVVGIAAAAPFANQAAAAPSTNSTAAQACLPRSAAPASPCARPSRAPYASQTSALVSLLRQDATAARYIMATQGSSPGGWVTRWVPVTHTGGGSGGFLDGAGDGCFNLSGWWVCSSSPHRVSHLLPSLPPTLSVSQYKAGKGIIPGTGHHVLHQANNTDQELDIGFYSLQAEPV